MEFKNRVCQADMEDLGKLVGKELISQGTSHRELHSWNEFFPTTVTR